LRPMDQNPLHLQQVVQAGDLPEWAIGSKRVFKFKVAAARQHQPRKERLL